MLTPPPLPTQRPLDWWTRNWPWFVPTLCVAGLLSVGGLVVFILGLMKSSPAYSGAVARAKASSEVAKVLGTPITEGFLFSGKIQENGRSGTAELTIPLRGPKGKGTLHADSTKADGKWTFVYLVVYVPETRSTIFISD